MSKHDQEDAVSPQPTGLGKALRQGRESKNFSVSRVADGLHLRPSIVTAIEDENYELLPGDLFLKGYIRSYARLVSLDEGKMINLLDQRLSDQANEQAEKKQALGKARRKKHSKHAVLVLVVAGIVGAAFYMWSQRLGDANLDVFDSAIEPITTSPVLDEEPVDKTEIETQEVIEPEPLDETEVMYEEASAVNKSVNDPANESKLESAVNDSNSVAAPSELDIEQKSVIEEKTEVEPEVVIESKQEQEQEQESELASKPVVETELLTTDVSLDIGVVSILFSGDCWFTLKNGEGKTVYADLKRAGDEINYSGPVPFTLVIGAVSEVSVLFEQEPVDFSTVRVRNNRAELELTH